MFYSLVILLRCIKHNINITFPSSFYKYKFNIKKSNKTRKKRQELSISATKSIKKENKKKRYSRKNKYFSKKAKKYNKFMIYVAKLHKKILIFD